METLGPERFREILLARRPILDVRAPVEFLAGSVPGSSNSPILTNEERHEIGTIYKEQGHEVAVRRGHELVSGEVKAARVATWVAFAENYPEGILTCFRGGMRSRLAQEWLEKAGHKRPRLEGGYKAMRRFLIEELERGSKRKLLVLSGPTGARKSLTLKDLPQHKVLDLEKLAHHRGSAFGGYLDPQPTPIDFENRLSLALMEREGALIVEDESRMIGRLAVPEKLFETLRASPVVMIEDSLEARIEITYNDYVRDLKEPEKFFANYRQALKNISRKLGGVRFSEISEDLEKAIAGGDHRVWIEKLLVWYYDPLYLGSLERRKPEIVFRGTRQEVLEYLSVFAKAEPASVLPAPSLQST